MKPKLICLTPVRNEAWVLDAFLTATSLWADHIIIADQNSTDGSREIYKKYPKATVIENNMQNMHMSRTRQLLFDEANKIEGDKIVITLDVDEVFVGNFLDTDGWKRILNSKQNDVFDFKWLNLYGSYYKSLVESKRPDGDWACNYGEKINGDWPDKYIHEPRLKYPENAEWISINDIKVIHFSRLTPKRQDNKEYFYQVSTIYNDRFVSAIRLHRMYFKGKENPELVDVDAKIYDFYKENGVDFEKLISKDDGKYYFEEVARMFDERGTVFYRKLDIWNKKWLVRLSEIAGKQIKDPRKWSDKLLHFYLRKTQKIKHALLIRGIDKILKKIY